MEWEQISSDKFRCKYCDKVFLTRAAFGRHRLGNPWDENRRCAKQNEFSRLDLVKDVNQIWRIESQIALTTAPLPRSPIKPKAKIEWEYDVPDRPANFCRRCGRDFASIRAFDKHLNPPDVPVGCSIIDVSEDEKDSRLRELGMEVDKRGRWCLVAAVEAARQYFGGA